MAHKLLTSEQVCQVFGDQLNSTHFTWEKYCGQRGVSTITIFDNEHDLLNKRFILCGWCHGESLPVRPRTSGYALMVYDREAEISEESVWCHVSDIFAETLVRKFNLIKK